MFGSTLACLMGLLHLASAASSTCVPRPKPNFIFIITDDQDVRLGSLNYQPVVQRELIQKGTTFSKHYCTIAICCPSRVSLLTGRTAHNTNVTDVSAPYGGYSKFVSEGWNEKYLPVWLQEAGYDTFYTGKLMNGHSLTSYDSPFPKGWTGNDYFLDPHTYKFYNVSMQHDRDPPTNHLNEYSTDLVANRTLGYLNRVLPDEKYGQPQKPFFIGVAPIAPHFDNTLGRQDPPVPALRHQHLFPDVKAPRTPNFNPEVPTSGGWIRGLKQQDQAAIDYGDEWFRLRIRSLQSVDEMITSILARLEEHPLVLANTYIIYTTDNGYHIGQHRLPPGKTCGIEEDINVPMIIRGPGVEKGKTVTLPTSHTDIVPTIFQLAGIPLQDDFDGVPMPVKKSQQLVPRKTEHINIEFWGTAVIEGRIGAQLIDNTFSTRNNTFKGLRIIAEDYDLAYTVWCHNEHELYEMKSDPWQIRNIYGTDSQTYGWSTAKLTARVDALLLTLKSCKGLICREPWRTLHPAGDVSSLKEAMNPKFDEFYLVRQSKVTFTSCQLGYLTEYEGALRPIAYSEAR